MKKNKMTYEAPVAVLALFSREDILTASLDYEGEIVQQYRDRNRDRSYF